MLTAEQTIATRRKCGALRFPFVYAHDQHDWAKVNSRLKPVKIYFSNSGADCEFRGSAPFSAKRHATRATGPLHLPQGRYRDDPDPIGYLPFSAVVSRWHGG